ncbi:hypothetical protein [Agrobacterium rubi]|uniref:hypothetical protein n=1 Tax=Agrobacterium rubi TaxID=28099 RepID=UPI001F3AA402|nr:hypothetical protein [Agrobacterium rubi]
MKNALEEFDDEYFNENLVFMQWRDVGWDECPGSRNFDGREFDGQKPEFHP